MKKVLIITYYWPPSGGGGVMRWLKMSKYLPEFGWKPIIYTPSNPDASVIDESLVSEIHPEVEEIKTPIWEPYDIYRKLIGSKKTEKFKAGYISEASSGSWKSKLSVFIRGNFLIPDPRKFWIKPSVKFLSKYLKENPVDLIVSTGPPHSMHLIALGLKKKFDIKWIADFRDPWTNIDFYDKLRLTKIADKIHHKLEKRVIEKADYIITVTKNWAEQFEYDYNKKVHVIMNGFDHMDFLVLDKELDQQFTITHIGALNRDRNPKTLWKVAHELSEKNSQFKKFLTINLIGQTDRNVLKSIQKAGLEANVKLTDYVNHKKVINIISRAQVLLLPINNSANSKGIIPGKTFEYLAAQRPIFAIGPTDGDTAHLIKDCEAGEVCDYEDKNRMESIICQYFELFLDNNLFLHHENHKQFSRRNLTKKLTELLK